jgi:hypothetical protein
MAAWDDDTTSGDLIFEYRNAPGTQRYRTHIAVHYDEEHETHIIGAVWYNEFTVPYVGVN